jgi:hypothetical protein
VEIAEVPAGAKEWIAVPVPAGLTEDERETLRTRWSRAARRADAQRSGPEDVARPQK